MLHIYPCREPMADLVDVHGAGPSEATGVIEAENMERGVIQAGSGRVQHAHEAALLIRRAGPRSRLWIGRTRLVTFTRDRLGYIHDGDSCTVRTATYRLHERRATLRIPGNSEMLLTSVSCVGWLVVFNVPSTARSFRDGTPIYCPLRRT